MNMMISYQELVRTFLSFSPVMHDTRTATGTGHMEDISLAYEKITHLYKDGNILHSDAWNEKKQA